MLQWQILNLAMVYNNIHSELNIRCDVALGLVTTVDAANLLMTVKWFAG